MSNNYAPYFNRINLSIIPSYIELPCFYHFCPSGSTLSQVTTLVIFFHQLLLYTFPVATLKMAISFALTQQNRISELHNSDQAF